MTTVSPAIPGDAFRLFAVLQVFRFDSTLLIKHSAVCFCGPQRLCAAAGSFARTGLDGDHVSHLSQSLDAFEQYYVHYLFHSSCAAPSHGREVAAIFPIRPARRQTPQAKALN